MSGNLTTMPLRTHETAPAHPSSPVAPASAELRAVVDRVSWRFIPFLMICYGFAYLDRVNVGFAKIQMADDLHLGEAAYGLGAGVFFAGYFLCEVPSNILLQRFGARRWISRIMISWATLATRAPSRT